MTRFPAEAATDAPQGGVLDAWASLPLEGVLEQARDDIGNKVGDQKIAGERLKYLDRLRTQATITFRNDELKKAYEQALADRQKAQVG